jgi:hypothetical protein
VAWFQLQFDRAMSLIEEVCEYISLSTQIVDAWSIQRLFHIILRQQFNAEFLR